MTKAMYHATPWSNFESIVDEGLKECLENLAGKGIVLEVTV